MGLRYRVAYPIPTLRGRSIDVAFTRAKLAVFVDGCFWHACPVHGTKPRANRDWWEAKLATNARRDAETNALLAADGWLVLRIWEHEEPRDAASRVRAALEQRSMPVERQLNRPDRQLGSPAA